MKVEQSKTGTVEEVDYSTFMRRKWRGIGYAYPVEWITPLGDTINGSVLINGKLATGKLYATKETHTEGFLFTGQDLLGIYHSGSKLLNDFEHNFAVYLTRSTTNCVWLRLVTVTEDNEAIKLYGAKSSRLTGFVSSICDERFAIEIDGQPLITCKRILFSTLVQNVYVSFQLQDQPKAECNTLDQTMITQSRLELVYARGLQETDDIWLEMNLHNCQMDQLRSQIKLSLNFCLDRAVWGVGTESIQLEKAVGIFYLHKSAKMEVTRVETDFCTEFPVRLGHGKERVLKIMNPITKTYYQFHTLTECNLLCLSLMILFKGTRIVFREKIEIAQCHSTTKADEKGHPANSST